MMIRTAGGPGLISPIDFGERRKPLPRSTWLVIGVVALAHVGVGVALYNQRFEIAIAAPPDPGPPITVLMHRPKPPEPVVAKEPPAPNMALNRTPSPPTNVEPLAAPIAETPSPNPTPLINLSRPVPLETPTGAGETPAEPARLPAVITRPRWASLPSAAQLMRAYPNRALGTGVSGSAALLCQVSAAGTLSGCAVTSETPSGQGFGRAATSLSRYFRMSPGTVDGQAIDGARVAFTVRFALED